MIKKISNEGQLNNSIPPQFSGKPVILIHFATSEKGEGRSLTACTGDKFELGQSGSYKDIPRVPCPGCHTAMARGYSAVPVEEIT